MEQEEKESNTPEEQVASKETPPAPAEEQPPESAPPSVESEGEPSGIVEEQVVLSKEEFDKLQKDARLTEDYRRDLLAMKGKKRTEEIFAAESAEAESPQESSPTDASPVLSDYYSKRTDIAAEFKEQLAGAPDAQYAIVKRQLELSEQSLLQRIRKSNSYVSRQQIKDMFTEAFKFAEFKTQSVPVGKENLPPSYDTGPTSSLRKTSPKKPEISDRARQIQPFTKDSSGNLLPIEKIQEMLDKGQLQ